MNLKKTVASLFAATAIVASLCAPAYADNDGERPTNASAGENGTFSVALSSGHSLSFGSGLVTTETGAQLPTIRGHNITIDEQHSTSPGWSVTLTATPLKVADTTYEILPENMSVTFRSYASQGCVYQSGNHSDLLNGNPSQPFQVVTPLSGTSTFADAVTLISADGGRGCGTVISTWNYGFFIPKGTYTGGPGQSATYEGKVTLTSSYGIGDEADTGVEPIGGEG